MHVVRIEGLHFVPEVLVVTAGDRVNWVNTDPFPHTVTADDRTFDSGNLSAAAQWSYAAGKPGTFPYRCSLHPTMKGKLIVR